MSAKKILVGLAIVLIAGAGIAANLWWREPEAAEVQVETVVRRDLTATVSGSGAIRPAREVDISSNVMGQITRLDVQEGQRVSRGDFLLEIDPARLRSTVEQMEAGLEAAHTAVRLAEENLEFARQTLDRREGLYQQELVSREVYERALQDVQAQQRNSEMRRMDVTRLEAQLEQARYDLTQVLIESPIDGIITRLNVEEGENVVTGTMNNPGTVIMTIANLSVIEAEIEVDETDIVNVEVGQFSTVRIDAFPDEEFAAVVAEVGKSPIQGFPQGASNTGQAINFKVVVRLDEAVPGARPGLSATADIVTATRDQALSVPIQALILREVEIGEEGDVIGGESWPPSETANDEASNGPASADEGEAGGGDPNDKIGSGVEPEGEAETVEREGAFVLRDGRAVFVPIEIGIAGERHFEVLSGIESGDRVIVGPFDVIRTLIDGDRVEAQEASRDGVSG